jgi:cellulose synthase/poly-beta-1,6-N-acetylglucosamine synthase-like glycosyltransferase
MDFWWILYIIDWALFIPMAITVIYLLFFSIAALFKHKAPAPKAKQENRFIVIIPSYRDDMLIFDTVNSILGQTYPQRMFDIVVVSDHQSEMTNMRLAQLPITLLTPNFEESSKAKSLQFAIINLPQFKIYDAVIVLDAGNIVVPEFLEMMNNAYEASGTKVVQPHRVARNLDTSTARLDAIFSEINNSVFRRGHTSVGLSSSLDGSGYLFNFAWFKQNIMKIRSLVGEDKELEAMLMHEGIFIDYADDILVYDYKASDWKSFNKERGQWIYNQLHCLLTNIRFLPAAVMNRRYDWIDKLLQWTMMPRTVMIAFLTIMSCTLPFIYFTLAIKWWFFAALALLACSIATPDYLVTKDWDKDFLNAPLVTIGSLYQFVRASRKGVEVRISNISHKLKYHR